MVRIEKTPMASNTQIKIRHGLILQAVLAQALRNAGYSFAETPSYDADSEVPDFLIPNAENPEFMLEVHQTDARDHFRMKTLRSLTAVAEAKAFFGADVASVNVLFGDPDNELPAANLRAMCGIFDVNVLLRRDASNTGKRDIARLEAAALELAGETDVGTAAAGKRLAGEHDQALTELKTLLTRAMSGAEIKESLKPMWDAETTRRATFRNPPEPGEQTYYKKNLVRSLFFQDEHFAAMTADPRPNAWSNVIKGQVVMMRIGSLTEEIDGDHLAIDPEFLSFLRDADAPRLRGLCKAVLDRIPAMHWFFEDLRDYHRRRKMAKILLDSIRTGTLEQLLRSNFAGATIQGIIHTRNWVVDMSRAAIGASQNDISRIIYNELNNVAGLLYPISHIGPNTAQFQAISTDKKESYVQDIVRALDLFQSRSGIRLSNLTEDELAASFLSLRFLGAMRLRKLDVLRLVAASIGQLVGLQLNPIRVESVLSDFAHQKAVARFELFEFADASHKCMFANFVAAEGNPRDKAKEWGARRLATLYRAPNGVAAPVGNVDAVFVIDGIWGAQDVVRLYRCGWTHVVRLGDLEATLRKVFGIKGAVKVSAKLPEAIALEDDEDELSIAAEIDKPPKLGRRNGNGNK